MSREMWREEIKHAENVAECVNSTQQRGDSSEPAHTISVTEALVDAGHTNVYSHEAIKQEPPDMMRDDEEITQPGQDTDLAVDEEVAQSLYSECAVKEEVASELYPDHVITEDLVIGPEVLLRGVVTVQDTSTHSSTVRSCPRCNQQLLCHVSGTQHRCEEGEKEKLATSPAGQERRRTRNLSEKKRRDQFNMLVNELSTMVSSNDRKMDKSSVLKSTIAFLKNHNEITVRSRAHDVQGDWKPAFLSNEEFTYLLLEALEGFVMVFSANGMVYYVSESITSLLGHNPADVVNKSIFDLAFENDRPNLYSLLQNPVSAVNPMQPVVKENEIRFQCHLRRGTLDLNNEPTYELIQFNGHFRTNIEQADGDNMSGYQQDHESRLLFVCTGRLYTPQLIRDVSLVDTSRNEFTSRHSLEWKFLFLDHRAPPIIGYLPFEVLGTSGYDYYHFDDLEKVVRCHEALMQKGELTSCYYRFLTKGQQWIWLQTRFYITYHQWNSKPELVVCTHRVVSYEDVTKTAKQEATEMDTSSEAPMTQGVSKEVLSDDATMVTLSPSYISENNTFQGSFYQPLSQNEVSASVKSAPASSATGAGAAAAGTGGAWAHNSSVRYAAVSETASLSGESRSSQRNGSRDVPNQFVNPEEIQQAQRGPTQVIYEEPHRTAITGYPPLHPSHKTGQNPHNI